MLTGGDAQAARSLQESCVSSAMTYRQAGATDLAICVALMDELIEEIGPREGGDALKRAVPGDFSAALSSPSIVVYLAECDGEVIGMSRGDILIDDPTFRLRDDPRCGYVDQMFVRQGHRDRGIGQRLIGLLEQWWIEQDVHHVLLHAAPKAARLYARLGYVPNREMYKQI